MRREDSHPDVAHSDAGIALRDSAEADMPAVCRIYAHHVLTGSASFEEVPPTVDEMLARRAAVLERGLPYLVAEHGGTGGRLLAALIDRCEAGPWRQMVAVIGDSGNTASIALHERLGFRHAGKLSAVGFKHGRWIDSVLMQRPLGAGSGTLPPHPTR